MGISKKILFFILLFTVISLRGTETFAQNLGISFGGGIGTYRMDDLKYYQEQLLKGFPVEARITSNFPPFAIGSVNIFKPVNDYLRLGLVYNFISTGAKASYSDYSGYVTATQTVKSHQFGISVNYRLFGNQLFDLYVYSNFMASLCYLDITTTIAASSQYFGVYYDNVIYQYKSFSPAGTVGFEWLIHLSDFSLGLDAGYQLDVGSELVNLENSSYYLADPYDPQRIMKTDLSGVRAQVRFYIWINKRKTEPEKADF